MCRRHFESLFNVILFRFRPSSQLAEPLVDAGSSAHQGVSLACQAQGDNADTTGVTSQDPTAEPSRSGPACQGVCFSPHCAYRTLKCAKCGEFRFSVAILISLKASNFLGTLVLCSCWSRSTGGRRLWTQGPSSPAWALMLSLALRSYFRPDF